MLSQGKKEIRGKDVFFQSEQPLLGLSLCIGEYRSLEMEEERISFFLVLFAFYQLWRNFGSVSSWGNGTCDECWEM